MTRETVTSSHVVYVWFPLSTLVPSPNVYVSALSEIPVALVCVRVWFVFCYVALLTGFALGVYIYD